MDEDALSHLSQHLDILCCPGCSADLVPGQVGLRCSGCGHAFEISDDVPRLFWPNDWPEARGDVTQAIRSFYEATPFPDYDEFDSVQSLIAKSRRGGLGKLLDDQVAPGAVVLECGCGTGQLTNFLSIANRTVFGTDICINSLELGQRFKRDNELERVHFLQMNLFRPAFKPESFDLVISNGVLHHTSDPFLAFRTIATLVKPGGYLLVGLYHRFGRLVTDLRRLVFRLSGDRLRFLDPNLRSTSWGDAKRRAWFMDQYKNPHESKHTIGEVVGWLREARLLFVKSIPHSRPFQPFSDDERLFDPERPGGRWERLAAELGMLLGGSREGGFFVVVARKPRQEPQNNV